MKHVRPHLSLTHDASREMIAIAIAEAASLQVAQVIVILDDGGRLKAMCRMDGAPLLSIEVARDKAYTALFGIPSGDLFKAISDDDALRATMPSLRRLTMIGGGFPIIVDGRLVGAIGVGGGTIAQDIACARAALEVLARTED